MLCHTVKQLFSWIRQRQVPLRVQFCRLHIQQVSMLDPLDAIIYGMSDSFNGLHVKCVSGNLLAPEQRRTYA